jgi:hypothetical protein
MVWAKLDDEILDNEKITQAGVLGFAMHVAAITWCCRKLTDGFLPYARVRLLLDLSTLDLEYLEATESPEGMHESFLSGVHNVGAVQASKIAERLISVGLWREDKERGGYWIHDFLDYNPSRKEAEAQKDALRAVRSEAGKRGAERRWSSRSDGKPDGKPDGKTMANAVANRSQSHGPDPDPDPDPVPDQDSLPSGVSARARGVGGGRVLRPDEPLTDQRRKDHEALTANLDPRDPEPEWRNFVDDRISKSILFASAAAVDAGWRKWVGQETVFRKKARLREQNDNGARSRRGAEITKQPFDPEAPWIKAFEETGS